MVQQNHPTQQTQGKAPDTWYHPHPPTPHSLNAPNAVQQSYTQQPQGKAKEAPGTTPTHPELTLQWQQRGNGLQAIIPAKEGNWCIQTKKQRGQGNTLYPSYHPSHWQLPMELTLSPTS